MKIALFVKDFAMGTKFNKDGLPSKSGAEFHAENHARQLIKRGNQVTIMAKKRYWFTKAREHIGDIDLVRLHEPFRGLEILLRLFTTHKKMDAVYIIGVPKFAVWAIWYATWAGIPVTLALTGKAEIFTVARNWRNRVFARCTHYVATTEEIKRGFIAQGGIAAEKITVLAHGIDTSKYPVPSQTEKIFLRRAHDIGDHVPILLFCARIVLNKGIDTLLKIWPIVHAARPEARLYVVGGGHEDFLAALRQMGHATDGSVVVTGEVDRPQEYYSLADAYVFPSRHEGLPTSLLEAMSSGLPAVASDIGGCEDIVFADHTGFLVPTEDAAAFAERILYLFGNEAECQRMSREAAEYVRAHCDYSQVIWRLEEIIADRAEKK